MAFTYEWKIKAIKTLADPSSKLDGAIVQTQWQCIGTDENGISGTFDGATPFNPDDIDPDNFTPYETLTEAQVLAWIQGEVNKQPDYKNHIDRQIQKQINAIARPVAEVEPSALPWAK